MVTGDPSRVRYVRVRDERFPLGAILAEADAPDYLEYRAGLCLAGEGGALMREILDAARGFDARNPQRAAKARNDQLKARRRRALRLAAAS